MQTHSKADFGEHLLDGRVLDDGDVLLIIIDHLAHILFEPLQRYRGFFLLQLSLPPVTQQHVNYGLGHEGQVVLLGGSCLQEWGFAIALLLDQKDIFTPLLQSTRREIGRTCLAQNAVTLRRR